MLTIVSQVLQFCLKVAYMVFFALKHYSASHAHQKGNISVIDSLLLKEIVLLLAALQRPLSISLILHHNFFIVLTEIPLIVEVVWLFLSIDGKVIVTENVVIIF